MEKPLKISVVSPVYKAENIVDKLCSRISEEVKKITSDYEIILVDDGSPDSSWSNISSNCLENNKIIGLKLSKNFGQHYAISAGLEIAKGDFIIILDCDLQDDPKYFKNLINKIKEGNDIVFTKKRSRKHSFFKNVSASIFYYLFNFLVSNQKATRDIGTYSIITKKVLIEYNKINDFHRHYLMILRTLGFKQDYIFVEHNSRFEGESSYTLSKLIKHASFGITSQSDKLLKTSIISGFILSILSLIWVLTLIFIYFKNGLQPGYTSLMAVIALSTGLILISIGICGIYIGKIFEQVKQKPLYIIEKRIN